MTNYEMTHTNIAQEVSNFGKQVSINLLQSSPRHIRMAYDYIQENFGVFETYFKHLGYIEEQIVAFKEKT